MAIESKDIKHGKCDLCGVIDRKCWVIWLSDVDFVDVCWNCITNAVRKIFEKGGSK
jgi:hypothetical protein